MPTFDRSVESQAYDTETGQFIIASHEAFEMIMKALIASIFGEKEKFEFMKDLVEASKEQKENKDRPCIMEGAATSAGNYTPPVAPPPRPGRSGSGH